HHIKQTRFLYYYCLCKSINELFHKCPDNFVLESGCKGKEFFNNMQEFSENNSKKYAKTPF
ncbi:MAG: hypothetical protein PUK67_07760, partial [Prevotellaceae bacterium]|nr:hypothetical protein [Prevotellaceae bacterium]MDY3365495.1 hypothetical protein [Prevotella sp.]